MGSHQKDYNSMYNVLMVCTGNICRSPMAEGLLAHDLPARLSGVITVTSAGTHALHGHQAEPNAVKAMDELGIDIRSHRARQVDHTIARNADLILTMEAVQTKAVKRLTRWRQTPTRLISEYNQTVDAHDIEDPYGGPLEAYQDCIRTLRPCLKGVIQWLENHL